MVRRKYLIQDSPLATSTLVSFLIALTGCSQAGRVMQAVAPSDAGEIVLTRDGQTLDLRGATLLGNPDPEQADAFTGRGIVVRGAKNVTVRNAVIRGFKVAIYAEDAPGLTIENCDVSGNYRQRLKSTPQREHIDDWIFGHENDDNQWLRFGAGIYLLRSAGATIRNCRARNGQNGICIVSSDRVTAVANDMSFMSGWGLAMWRSSFCKVISNRFDYCIRGYSHGVYARGQDSTGILVYEQCSDNVFAYNSATHGGDGFFLYAGHETTQRTGRGGCNRNLVYMNDFSHAVANGIEATFSDRNIFLANKLNHCDHGLWGGYSTNSLIAGNEMRECNNGVSIEHGRGNRIVMNLFDACKRGIWLWWDDDKDLLASPYCREQGGESADESLVSNRFINCRNAVYARESRRLRLLDNAFDACAKDQDIEGTDATAQPTAEDRRFEHAITTRVRNQDCAFAGDFAISQTLWDFAQGMKLPVVAFDMPDRMGFAPLKPLPGICEGKEHVVITDWGPYDFSRPLVWPDRLAGWSPLTAKVFGPPGSEFEVEPPADSSLQVSPSRGRTPGTITISTLPPPHTGPSRAANFATNVQIGGAKLPLSGTLLFATWTTRFYEWTDETDPRKGDAAWEKLIAGKPFRGEHGPSLEYTWGGGGPTAIYEAVENARAAKGDAQDAARSISEPRIVRDRFALVARTQMNLPAGKWRLRTISDDGVRVYLDDRRVIDNWTWHVPTEDTVEFDSPGALHQFQVEYFEIDGHAQLQFFLEPG